MSYIGRAPTASMLDKTDVAAKKVALRQLPPAVETHLATLENTDDISAYVPDALE
jgi:hypothetical protein